MTHIVKAGSIASGLALMLTTLCYGQSGAIPLLQWAPYSGPPHNVIYWDGEPDNPQMPAVVGPILQSLATSAYTDVIVGFVSPDSGCTVSPPPNDIEARIKYLHSFGKTVLVSFGGAFMDPGVQSTAYAACANNLLQLEGQLVNIVMTNGFDGVDIDFEDSNALSSMPNPIPQYAAIPFLTSLTSDLEAQLGVNCPIMPSSPCLSIVTHAPQNVYWTPSYNSAYIMVSRNTVDASGHAAIAWFNNQTYNNCGADMTGTDCTEAQKVMEYQTIVNDGVMPTQLVVGLPVSQCATNSDQKNAPGNIVDPAGCTHDGWIPLINPGNDVQGLISTLNQVYPGNNQYYPGSYPGSFGGVMGWDYSWDMTNPNLPGDPQSGMWGSSVSNSLELKNGTWSGGNFATNMCLDSDSSGNVSTDSCANSLTQNWQFKVNSIVNLQTQNCLDSNASGSVYALACNGGNFQNWQFFGSFIFDRQTRLCLQDNGGTVVTAPCDANNRSQMWFNANIR